MVTRATLCYHLPDIFSLLNLHKKLFGDFEINMDDLIVSNTVVVGVTFFI